MQKMKSKGHKGSLGASANGGSRKLVEGFEFWGRNRVKMASPLPFLCFLIKPCSPRQAILFFFCKNILFKVMLFIVIFSL